MKLTTQFWGCVSVAALLAAGGAWAQEAETDDSDRTLERVVVTGSFIKRDVTDQFDSANPIDNLGQEAFTDTGILSNAELARTLTYNTGSENQADALTQGQNVGTANVNLRGLGVGSTLVLVNGQRQTVSGAVTNRGDTFVDLTTLLPQIMIGNIEVVKDGAAALYGSDAVAGVVNFKTRNDFEGVELRYNYQQTGRGDDHDTQNFQALFGTQGDRSSLVAALSYTETSELVLPDRPNFPTATVSSFGNPGSFLLLGPSPTIPTATPGAFNADPECGGPNNPEGINTGSLCLFDFGQNYSLVADQEIFQIYAVASQMLTEDDELTFEVGYTSADYVNGYSTSFPNLNFPVVAADHPGNPYDVDVLWRGRVVGNNGLTPGDNRALGTFGDDTYRASLGLTGDLFSTGWDYATHFTFSRDDRYQQVPDQIGQNLNLALAGLGGPDCDLINGTPGVGDCQYYNPFGSSLTTQPNDPDLIDYLTLTDPVNIRTDLTTFDAIVTGDIMEMPAGPLSAAFGYQNRSETRVTDNPVASEAEDLIFLIGTPDSEGDRTVDAFFGELAIPLMDNDQLGTLDAQLAVRYEDYSSGQSSTDPKIALRWAPQDNLSLRASWSSAFRAPTLFQITNQQTALNATLDPLTGSIVFLAETARPNVNLDPEEADTINLGASWEPIENLVFDVDYYNVEYTNLISTQVGQQLLIQEVATLGAAGCALADITSMDATCLGLLNPNIIRDPTTGTALRIFTERENAPSAKTDGFDITASYQFEYGNWGTFGVKSQNSFVNSFEIELTDGSTVEGAGARNANTPFANPIPEFRSNTSFSWAKDRHSINSVLRFISSYDETDASGDVIGEVDSWTTFDIQYNYELDSLFGFGSGTKFTLGAINLFDEDPPFVSGQSNELGYDTKVHDPRGQMLYFSLTQKFQ
jgi:outer membrane receptor protein involved in Fe transport